MTNLRKAKLEDYDTVIFQLKICFFDAQNLHLVIKDLDGKSPTIDYFYKIVYETTASMDENIAWNPSIPFLLSSFLYDIAKQHSKILKFNKEKEEGEAPDPQFEFPFPVDELFDGDFMIAIQLLQKLGYTCYRYISMNTGKDIMIVSWGDKVVLPTSKLSDKEFENMANDIAERLSDMEI